jgi:small conductance mechanosensitive channel
MKKRFDALGIEMPFPHRTIYFGADKDGNAPPARVRMTGATPTPVAATAGAKPSG